MPILSTFVSLWGNIPSLRLATYAIIAILLSIILRMMVFAVARRLQKRHASLKPVFDNIARPLKWLVPLIVFAVIINSAPSLDDLGWLSLLRRLLLCAMIGSAAWLIAAVIKGFEQSYSSSFSRHKDTSQYSRRVLTQVSLISRMSMVVVTIIGLSGMLMMIPAVRQVGTSLLASAGVAGIVVGFAARPVLSNIIAGIQIALTQPISLDDLVVIEGVMGYVEEINTTYVVIRTWDERRLIVPLTYFVENPISSWTRTDEHLTGTIYLWVDYHLPLEPLREELKKLVKVAPHYNGRDLQLDVSDTNERAMQLRILVSADGMPAWWAVSCFVREGLIRFIASNYPGYLPTERTQLQSGEGFSSQSFGMSLSSDGSSSHP
ncbi:hypothetical protein LMG33818_000717 [Halomonadaceae bacterium LMG 33818]|uniref:mechanosensitive ion channel family protein n=1 Tax=Cernens ardua TaxID=3402176 RepID=UPI003EDBA5F9